MALQPVQPVLMRQQNIGVILRAVRSGGPLARADITENTGISSGTVTKLTSALLAEGILTERINGVSTGQAGRPRVPLDISTRSRVVLAAHIGLRRFTVAALDLKARVISQRLQQHRSTEAMGVLHQVSEALDQLRADLPDRRVVGVGVSTGGAIDHTTGTLLSHPGSDWNRVPVRRALEEATGLPVEYDETVRGSVSAELLYGVERKIENVLAVFVGNVIGAAFDVNRFVHRGANGLAGGITHLPILDVEGPVCECGRRSCFGTVASNDAVLQRGLKQGVVAEHEEYDSLVLRAGAGDIRAAELLNWRASLVGQAVTTVAEIVDPHTVILLGNGFDHPETIDVVRSEAGRRSHTAANLADRIRRPSFADATPVSAAAIFLDRYFAEPATFEPGLRLAEK